MLDARTRPSRRWACRCRVCRARQMKAKHPTEYAREPRCKGCSRVGTLVVDKWADERRWRKQTCHCEGQALYRTGHIPWPHRKGSKGCLYHEQTLNEIEEMEKKRYDY